MSMGKASAIPHNLYQYADRCTHAASDAQHAARGLEGAFSDFLAGCSGVESGVDIDVSAVTGLLTGISGQLSRQIAASFYLDRSVRTTGLAFQQAGARGGVNAPPDSLIRTRDDLVQRGISAYQAGVAAAAKLPDQWPADFADRDALPPDAIENPIFKLLMDHADDPEFCRGLLEGGGSRALKSLLGSLADGQLALYLTAHPGAGGSATDLVSRILRNALSDRSLADSLAPSLPEAMSEPLENMPENWRLAEAWRALLPAYTVIVSSLRDPDRIRDILTALPLSEKLAPEDLEKVKEPLNQFLMAAAAHMLTDPPATNDPEAMAKWAAGAGESLSWLLRYSEWMGKIDQHAEHTAEGRAGSLTTFGLEVINGVLLSFAPEIGVPGEIVLHSLGGVAVYKLEPSLSKMLLGGGSERLDAALLRKLEEDAEKYKAANGQEMSPQQRYADLIEHQAMTLAVIQAFNSGRVHSVETGKRVTLQEALGGKDVAALADELDNPDWGSKYAVNSRHGQSLSLVFGKVHEAILLAEKYGTHQH
jgi:hypothetical protein